MQLISEDSFGVDTIFAAYTTSGDYGIMVNNTGGTGVDQSSQGVLFARIAVAVAGGASSAAPA